MAVKWGQAQNKYNAKKVETDGIIFDSKKERDKYLELLLLQKAGEVVSFDLQPQFILQEGYRGKDGKWVRPITYRADFRVRYSDGREVVLDSKGFRTKDYRLKRKMFEYKYRDIEFKEV